MNTNCTKIANVAKFEPKLIVSLKKIHNLHIIIERKSCIPSTCMIIKFCKVWTAWRLQLLFYDQHYIKQYSL